MNVAKLIEDYYAAWCTQDADKISSFFTDDCVCEDVPNNKISKGKEEFKKILNPTFDDFPDYRVELKFYIVAGEWVGTEWIMTGTRKGEWPGSPAAGKSFSVRGASFIQIKDGKIALNRDYYDLKAFLDQTRPSYR
jgi:steroid delta-isomerase-like uncharacterized protein